MSDHVQLHDEVEKMFLSEYACRTADTRGRQIPMASCDMRTEFQRDRDRIIHCQSFRRLMYKTQVFLAPAGDHYRTRLTHTLEVCQIARTIARALRLNEDLTEAIALGHDLGHTPFGHAGETVMQQCYSSDFSHNLQGVRVVSKLENGGAGLNLTAEVIDGIACHSGSVMPKTLEGAIIRYADRIAYINHDIDDAIRAGILNKEDIPSSLTGVLGESHGERINTMVRSVLTASEDSATIAMTPDVQAATNDLRAFLFERVYLNPKAKAEETKAKDVVCTLFDFFVGHPDKLPDRYRTRIGTAEGETVERAVADFISGMTDRYAIEAYEERFVPRVWRGLHE